MWHFGEQLELPLALGGNSLAGNDPATTTIHGQAKEPTLSKLAPARSSVRDYREIDCSEGIEGEDK